MDEGLKDGWGIVDGSAGRDGIAAFGNLCLALAVIAKLACFQHSWQANHFYRIGQLRGAVDRRIGRGRYLQRADEILLDEPVLCSPDHFRVSHAQPALSHEYPRLTRHI